MTRLRQAGFTLVEVMIALAILAIGLTTLITGVANNVANVHEAELMGIAAELARGKMYDIEEELAKEGFKDTDQSSNGDFSDEGWPQFHWEAKVETPEMPTLSAVQQMQAEQAKAAGQAAGQAAAGQAPGATPASEETSGLAAMLAFAGVDPASAADTAGSSFVQQYFEMIQEVLKVSIRKVTLTVEYQMLGEERSQVLIAYFTAPGAMDTVLGGLGATPAGGEDGGAGTRGGGPRIPGLQAPGRPRGGGGQGK